MAECTFVQRYARRPLIATASMSVGRASDHSKDVSQISKRTALWVLPLVLLTLAACARIGNPEGWSGGAVAGDVLYIGTAGGELVALDRSTGKRLWTFELEGEEQREHAIYGTPAIADDVLYIGGYDSILYAVSLDDGAKPDEEGKLKKESKGRVMVGGPIVGGPVVVDNVVLVGSSDGNMYAFDVIEESGRLRFRERRGFPFHTGNKVWSTPAVANGVVYFGSLDKKVYAVALENGDKVWEFKTGGAVVAEPVVAGGRVYVGAFDGVFYAIDASTGNEVWRFEGADNWFWGHAIYAEDAIYAPSLDGNLYALDADTGRLRWTLETEGPLVGSPVVVFDMIAVPSADGRIRLAELAGGGSVLRRCNTEQEIRTPLVEQEGFIYFGARDRSVRALQIEPDGSPLEQWAHFTDRDEIERWLCIGPK